MITWLRKIFGLCEHKWILKASTKLVSYEGAMPHGVRYILQCEKCGNIKQKDCK